MVGPLSLTGASTSPFPSPDDRGAAVGMQHDLALLLALADDWADLGCDLVVTWWESVELVVPQTWIPFLIWFFLWGFIFGDGF